MTRLFRLELTTDGSSLVCLRRYAPEHSPAAVPADDLLTLLGPAVGKTLAAMSSDASEYLRGSILDDNAPSSSVLVSAAEI